MQSRTTLFQSHILSWKVAGDPQNTALMLIHGFCEDSRVFTQLAEKLSDSLYVVMPDVPGFGQSESSPNTFMAAYAQAMFLILSQEKIDRVWVAGHSMGGYIALEMVSQGQFEILGFGLINSTARADSEEKRQNRLKAAEFVSKEGTRAFVRTLIPTLFSPKAAKHLITEQTEQAASCSAEGVIQASLAMRERKDYTSLLQATHLSVFWAIGKDDQVVPMDDALSQALMSDVSYVRIFEDAGHMTMIEAPDRLAEELLRWVS